MSRRRLQLMDHATNMLILDAVRTPRGKGREDGALAGVPLVLVPRRRDPEVFDRLVALAELNGVTLNIEREVVAYPSVMAMVALGTGWGLVPLAMAGAAPKGVSVRPLDVPDPPAITVRIVQRDGPEDRRTAALIDRLRAFTWAED